MNHDRMLELSAIVAAAKHFDMSAYVADPVSGEHVDKPIALAGGVGEDWDCGAAGCIAGTEAMKVMWECGHEETAFVDFAEMYLPSMYMLNQWTGPTRAQLSTHHIARHSLDLTDNQASFLFTSDLMMGLNQEEIAEVLRRLAKGEAEFVTGEEALKLKGVEHSTNIVDTLTRKVIIVWDEDQCASYLADTDLDPEEVFGDGC